MCKCKYTGDNGICFNDKAEAIFCPTKTYDHHSEQCECDWFEESTNDAVMNNENEIERMASIIIKHPLESHASAVELLEKGFGDKEQAAKSAVRDFITRLSYVRKSTVDDNGEPIVTVGVVNFDDMVDMFHELYGVGNNETNN